MSRWKWSWFLSIRLIKKTGEMTFEIYRQTNNRIVYFGFLLVLGILHLSNE